MRFARSFCFAVAGLAIALQMWLAVQLPDLFAMYAELRSPLPLVTRIAFSSLWRYGAPITMGALVGLAIARRGTHPRMPLVVALVCVAILVATYLAAEWPVFQLAGNIQ